MQCDFFYTALDALIVFSASFPSQAVFGRAAWRKVGRLGADGGDPFLCPQRVRSIEESP